VPAVAWVGSGPLRCGVAQEPNQSLHCETMASDELQRSWQITRQHLDAARSQLPKEYEDWLAHNELELAFDELEGIGLEVTCNHAFWSELLAAAENMSLPEHAERCRQQLSET
jgi:hypothetical protein